MAKSCSIFAGLMWNLSIFALNSSYRATKSVYKTGVILAKKSYSFGSEKAINFIKCSQRLNEDYIRYKILKNELEINYKSKELIKKTRKEKRSSKY